MTLLEVYEDNLLKMVFIKLVGKDLEKNPMKRVMLYQHSIEYCTIEYSTLKCLTKLAICNEIFEDVQLKERK